MGEEARHGDPEYEYDGMEAAYEDSSTSQNQVPATAESVGHNTTTQHSISSE